MFKLKIVYRFLGFYNHKASIFSVTIFFLFYYLSYSYGLLFGLVFYLLVFLILIIFSLFINFTSKQAFKELLFYSFLILFLFTFSSFINVYVSTFSMSIYFFIILFIFCIIYLIIAVLRDCFTFDSFFNFVIFAVFVCILMSLYTYSLSEILTFFMNLSYNQNLSYEEAMLTNTTIYSIGHFFKVYYNFAYVLFDLEVIASMVNYHFYALSFLFLISFLGMCILLYFIYISIF